MRSLILILSVATVLTACGIKGDPLPVNVEAPCPYCE